MTGWRTLARVIGVSVALAAGSSVAAENYGDTPADAAALVKAMAGAKLTLAQGIQQVAKGTEAATVAKFEYEDGVLHLSVYTSAKGVKTDADQNVLKEYGGDATQAAWKAEVEVFDDVKHVARAAEYHALMAISPSSLLDIAKKAEAEGDKVLWVQPRIVDAKPIFDVGVMKGTQLIKVRYGLLDGKKL